MAQLAPTFVLVAQSWRPSDMSIPFCGLTEDQVYNLK